MASPRPAAVGGFVLGGLAIVVAAILFFGGSGLFASRLEAVAYFEGSVGGLSPGAAVTFRGVRVGAVSRVALIVNPTDLQARIPVTLTLERDQVTLAAGTGGLPLLRKLIEAGLRAKLVSQSLVTGQMLVELDLEPNSPAHRVGGADSGVPEIPTTPSDLEELRQHLTQAPIVQTVAQALRTLAAIERVADHLDAEIGPLAASARATLDRAGNTIEIAGAAVPRLERDATATLDEARGLARDGRQLLAARGGELSRALADADKALQAIGGLALTASNLVAPRSQARMDLEATLRDLAASASALRDFSQAIERDPSVVLRGRATR